MRIRGEILSKLDSEGKYGDKDCSITLVKNEFLIDGKEEVMKNLMDNIFLETKEYGEQSIHKLINLALTSDSSNVAEGVHLRLLLDPSTFKDIKGYLLILQDENFEIS